MRENKTSGFFAAYRNDSSIDEIPAFEGQPMNLTLKQQIQAAGGSIINVFNDADILLAVNNFNGSQIEAANQPKNPDSSVWWFKFEPLIKNAVSQNKTIGFCDNRYANGGDSALIKLVFNYCVGIDVDGFHKILVG